MQHNLIYSVNPLIELPYTIYWKILISILGMSGYVTSIFQEKYGWTICK